jgi:hypothetical protein
MYIPSNSFAQISATPITIAKGKSFSNISGFFSGAL